MKVRQYLKLKNLGVPSPFDIAVILFIVILPFIKMGNFSYNMVRGMFLIYGTIALMLFGMAQKPRRVYTSVYLSLLSLWLYIPCMWLSL